MKDFRLSRGLCAVIGEVLPGSHSTLQRLFTSSGAPGPPPEGSHEVKWKEWLFRIGNDPNVDTLKVLGGILEEWMDAPSSALSDNYTKWKDARERVVNALEENGLRYYRCGRLLPTGEQPASPEPTRATLRPAEDSLKPSGIAELLEILIKGLRKAMYPLARRRKGAQTLSFSSEYDVQDLLHTLLRPWVADIRPEEFTPSYAGSSTRMDFLLPKYKIVVELKFVRDSGHARKIGDELIVDIEHYRRHPDCEELWCVVYDQDHLLSNGAALQGPRRRTHNKGRQGERKGDDPVIVPCVANAPHESRRPPLRAPRVAAIYGYRSI
jgi:hypothetical protein